ncbi:CopL family metal-binding regulatory protein [Luteimonas composti]
MLPSLLRLLLCLCLLADAVGPAMAATHLAMADVPTDAVPGDQDDGTHGVDADCHAAPGQAPNDTPGEDCLERCLELCLKHCVAAVPAMIALASPDPGAIPVRPAGAQVATAHATPILRPPIA